MDSMWRGHAVILTPAWLRGDGVGHDVEGMARALIADGFKTYVYSPYHTEKDYEIWTTSVETIRALLQLEDTILIYHHSVGADLTESLLLSARCKTRIMRYHNVTPPAFFEGYNEDWVRNCATGRRVTYELVKACTDFLVPSYYDARDLINAGVNPSKITYLPYFHKLDDFDRTTENSETVSRLKNDSRLHVLFVGRRVNNKGHKHLLEIIAKYCEMYDRDIVLHIVGTKDAGLAKYNEELLSLTNELNITENVIFYDKSSFDSIVAFYKNCDVFLCTSEHEGFCIPIIEAEYCGLPVIAYYYTGVPEALGPTQISIDTLNYAKYAVELRRIRTESGLKESLGEAGSQSVRERFSIEDTIQNFNQYIGKLFTQKHHSTVLNSGVVTTSKSSLASKRLRVAFVVQRFGKQVSGGAETFVRLFAERLSSIFDITVVSTSSLTMDWENSVPLYEDEASDPRYKVIRFPARHKRDWEAFSAGTVKAAKSEIDISEWMASHGPQVPEMATYLMKHHDQFDVVVNWTYLFSNMEYVARLSGKVPLICVPFFHDENFAYLPGMQDLCAAYEGFVFQTDAERNLADQLYPIENAQKITLGCGINEDSVGTRSLERQDRFPWPYIVYVGRIEPAKAVDELFRLFEKYKADFPGDLKLVLIGKPFQIEIPKHPDIVHAGFVSDEDKQIIIDQALVLVNPSHFESFSLVLLEAWAMSCPVLVTTSCNATSEQVRKSGGGLVFSNYRDFAWCLNMLQSNPELAKTLGEEGHEYYVQNYLWSELTPRLSAFISDTHRYWLGKNGQESTSLLEYNESPDDEVMPPSRKGLPI
ncbi:glycosyltransferase family 4 protein [Asticcacaulis benevestitus]|uniref:Glycosyl transferase family 1 domain-containing protein n=1 Tax=Asticcacaulis benevestitus DSM 16100 = ATCC BAA-896 TaxID=1121022 RepID=V4PUS1_9CAUL|nr:glycosyltransferase family 4 protein [Asticcacaulis benevestitus]ESQ91129.1 hypothetical protein ABENE_10755 [Asticcacaulis benevestitus DSM 16100 = ATCC BAA-896]